MKIATAVRRLLKTVDLEPGAVVLGEQAVRLAGQLDDDAIPPYAAAAAHRELRALVADLGGGADRRQGVTDAELEALFCRVTEVDGAG